jgi:hypothetical protein
MTDEQLTKQTDEKFVTLGTKVSRHAAEQLARIAKRKGLTIYELIQITCDTFIRYSDDRYNLSEEMERAMSVFEHMVGWADALNLADPTVHKEVCQAVYIFQDADGQKKGFRAKMVDKPFMGQWTEDSNVMHIFERIFCICMPELYLKLVRARILLEADSVSEVINMLADAEVIMQLNNEYRKEFEDAARTDGGKSYAYGRKTKSVQHRTPDSLAQDQRIKFDYGDREAAEREADDD